MTDADLKTLCLGEIIEFTNNYKTYDLSDELTIESKKTQCDWEEAYQLGCKHGEQLLAGSIRNIITGWGLEKCNLE